VADFEASIGRTLDIDQHYYSWTITFPSGLEQADLSAGRIPLVTWEPWGTTLDAINSGTFDTMIRARARGLRDLRAPVFLRWAHEMNSNWYPWSGYANNDAGTTNGPAKYVAAYRRVHDLFAAEGATNVVWVWSPNFENVPSSSWNAWSNYYPGDAYVDWVGPDGYNWGTTKSWSSWRSFKSIFSPIYSAYAGRKPIMLAEVASQEAGGNKGLWIDDMSLQLQTAMPAIKAVVWFHRPTGWPADTSVGSFAAFRTMATLPYFNP
ncbi:MAG TPA: glycosyl hydrolase, partial [Actinomycetota bacterium]|nr:glycosyl hydrolase [Actinomycetota bacterium]